MSFPALTAIALYAILQAALYCSLLPLWQGYDEPYHFGYAQHLAVHREIPVLDRTGVSAEVRQARLLTPESHVNPKDLPGLLTFSQYFALSEAEAARTSRAPRLPAVPSARPGRRAAQLRSAAAPARLPAARCDRAHRLLPCCCSRPERLGQRFGLPPSYRAAAVFLLCSTQSLYATVAHVGNDWLSVPLIALLFLAAERFYRQRDTRSALLFAGVLGVGLLAKSYFLVFVPFALALVLFVRARQALPFLALLAALAGPWYLRNWIHP